MIYASRDRYDSWVLVGRTLGLVSTPIATFCEEIKIAVDKLERESLSDNLCLGVGVEAMEDSDSD